MYGHAVDDFNKKDYDSCLQTLNALLSVEQDYSPYTAYPSSADIRKALLLRCDAYYQIEKFEDSLKDAHVLVKRFGKQDLAAAWRRLRGMLALTFGPELESYAKEVKEVVAALRRGRSEGDFAAMTTEDLREFLVNRGVDATRIDCKADLVAQALFEQSVDGPQLNASMIEDVETTERILRDVDIGVATVSARPISDLNARVAAKWLYNRLKVSHMRVLVISIRNQSDIALSFNQKHSVFVEGRFKVGFEPPSVLLPRQAITLVTQNRNYCMTGVAGTLVFDTDRFSVAMAFSNPLRGPFRSGVAFALDVKRSPVVEDPQPGHRQAVVNTRSGAYRASSWGTSIQNFSIIRQVMIRLSDDQLAQLFNMLPAASLRKCTAICRPWRQLLLTAHPERFFTHSQSIPAFPDYCCNDDFVTSNWTSTRDRNFLIEAEKSTYIGFHDFTVTDVVRKERAFAVRYTRSMPSQEFTIFYRNWNFPMLRMVERSLTFHSTFDLIMLPSGRAIGCVGRKIGSNEVQIQFNEEIVYAYAGPNTTRILHVEGSPVSRKLGSSGTRPVLAATIDSPTLHVVTLDVMKGTDALHMLILAVLKVHCFSDD